MNHDDSAGNDEAVEGPANARPTARAQLEQAFTKGPRVRQPKVWAMLCQKLGEAREVSQNIYRPRMDLRQHTFVKVLDLKRHARRLAHALTARKYA